jgi:hypothetical protein
LKNGIGFLIFLADYIIFNVTGSNQRANPREKFSQIKTKLKALLKHNSSVFNKKFSLKSKYRNFFNAKLQ